MKATITIDGVSAEVILTPEQEGLFNPKQFGRHRVKRGVVYWYLICCGEIRNSSENNDDYDNGRFERGNYFPSFAKALAHAKYTLAVVKVNDRIDQLNQGWKMVWDLDTRAYSIFYSQLEQEFDIDFFSSYQSPSVIKYLSTKQIAEQIIKELTPELEVIFNYQS